MTNSLTTKRKCGTYKENEGVWEQEILEYKRHEVTG
jgi:hypothetical protein